MNHPHFGAGARLALLTLAVACAFQAQAATRIVLNPNLQRDAMPANLDLRSTTAVVKTADGSQKVKYQQYYQGVRVWGEQAPVGQFAKIGNGVLADAPAFTSGVVVDGIATDLPAAKPRLSSADITRLVRNLVSRQGKDVRHAELEENELLIRLDEKGRAQLFYLASLHLPGADASSPTFMIDANTGAVISNWDGLAHRDAQGPGGNEKIGKYVYGKDFKPLDIAQDCTYDNTDVSTIDMGNQTAEVTTLYKIANCPATGTPENDVRPSNGAYSPLNDGHFFGGVVFNMYRDWYQSRPIQQKLTVRVHYGSNYQNAFWDGKRMTFGDGGSSMYPLVSVGVMAHEVSHGFTQQHAGLLYKGMSGGMNEAFSDMAAQAAEQYMFGKPTWLIGGEIVKGGADKALRYMLDPEKDGRSIGNASKYTDALNVHYTSGVYNKAFALLGTTAGWDARKAFEVFMVANQLYWKPNSTFNEGACGVIQAAQDKGYKSDDVINAFNQVGLKCDSATGGGSGGNGGGAGGGTSATTLNSGVAVSNQSLTANGSQRFTITVPAGASFLAVRSGAGTGNVNLYARVGGDASPTSNDAKSEGASNAEGILIKQPKAGSYSILLQATAASAGVSLIATTR